MLIKKIACVSMMFPAPSETFHSNNVRAISELNCEVRVFTLLTRHERHQSMVRERGLLDITIDNSNTKNYLKGIGTALSNPVLLLNLLAFIVKNTKGFHLLKSLFLLPRIFNIWSKISEWKPEVVNLLWGHLPVLVGFLVKTSNPEVVLSMGLMAYDLENHFGGSAAIVPYVDLVWTQASWNIPLIRSLGFPESKIRLILDGLDLSTIIGEEPKIPGRIITAGRLIKPKGIDLCLHTFSLVMKKWPASSLVILGEGPELPRLKTLADHLGISSYVSFKGHVSMKDVASELAASEIFLFMSFKAGERLPNVIKEAMANKAVCLVSRTPGIEELVDDKITGFILDDNTPEEAFRIIDDLFKDPKGQVVVRERGFHFIVENFDCRKEMQKLFSEWERINPPINK